MVFKAGRGCPMIGRAIRGSWEVPVIRFTRAHAELRS